MEPGYKKISLIHTGCGGPFIPGPDISGKCGTCGIEMRWEKTLTELRKGCARNANNAAAAEEPAEHPPETGDSPANEPIMDDGEFMEAMGIRFLEDGEQ